MCDEADDDHTVQMKVSRVKEGVIPTEIAYKPCHGVSNGITNCCTGVRQPKVHMLKYKKVQETLRHTLIERRSE